MAIETTGKTIDAAINAALEQLGTDRDSVTVEVLENPKTGFLGLGGTPARVRVKKIGEEDDKPPVTPLTAKKESKAVPKAEPKQSAPPQTKTDAPKAAAAKSNAAAVLKGILDRMGFEGTVITETESERCLLLEISGSNMGRLIGRRGDTLDSVQRIVSSSVNKGSPERRRIVVDAERYRAKREESLISMAHTTAGKVVKYNRDMLLEPMNAYSRHVIHTALQDNPYVTTHSVGNEPQRRVIISLSGAKKTAAPPRSDGWNS
ncbi:MAG: protein jag [Oscillospiraceae bacterium]|nr:protein jag [Oscillospiraceae bacterium]